MKTFILALSGILFLFPAFAQSPPLPVAKPFLCKTPDEVIAEIANKANILPWRYVRTPKFPDIVILSYPNGIGVAIEVDKNDCILRSHIFHDTSPAPSPGKTLWRET